MKIKRKYLLFGFLSIYYVTKMLWDTLVPNVFELLSLALVVYGFGSFLLKDLKRNNISLVVLYIIISMYVVVNGLIQDNAQQLSRALYEYVFYMTMIFACCYYIKRIDILKICKFLWVIGIVLAILSWYEFLSKSYIIGSFTNLITYNGLKTGFRAAVFSRSYLSHGVVLGFFTLISYYLFIVTERKRYFATAIAIAISILTTSSRGPLVATFGAILVAYVLNQYRVSKRIDKIVLTWITLGLLGLGAFWFLTSTFTTGNTTIDYFLYRMRQIINWTGDAGNVGRIYLWNNAITAWFKSNIWFGIGPSKTGSWGVASLGVTESGVLKHLCELGIIGFTFYYLFIAKVLISAGKAFKNNASTDRTNFVLYFALVVMILINNITVQGIEEIMVFFIYSFGMGGLMAETTKNVQKRRTVQ